MKYLLWFFEYQPFNEKLQKQFKKFSKKFVELKNCNTFATSFKKQIIIRNKKFEDFAGLMKEY